MYNFPPMTDEEIAQSSLVPEGIYDFKVAKSTRKTSKALNPMAELQLTIWDAEGKTHFIYDFLVFSTIALNIKKIKHFCDSVGLQDKYKLGQLPEELEGFGGKVSIGIEDEKPNPRGGMFPKKNVVLDYLSDATLAAAKAAPVADVKIFDDSIPF